MTRVLLLTNLYPSRNEPTRGVFNRNRFGALARYCDAYVVSPAPWWTRVRRRRELFSVPAESDSGITAAFPTYWSLPGIPVLHARGMYTSLRPLVRRLRNDFPFDIILAAWAYPDAVAGAMLARDFGCPLVTMTLGSDINELARNPRLRPQIQWTLSRSHRVVAVSAALRDRLVDLGVPADRVIVQHNGVDGDSFVIQDRRQVRARLGFDGDRKCICYVGNLKSEKGVDVLVGAMDALVHKRKRDLDLVIVGSGVEEEQLRGEVEARGLQSCVRFAGRRPHDEIKDWIGACDVLCLPSRREGCPNVVLEALSCGRPVVASDVGGVPELLSAANGIVVPPDDPDALAAALDIAISRKWDPNLLRNSVGTLSWDQFGRTLHDVLTSAIDSRRELVGSAA